MPQTCGNIILHLIFSTKQRLPLIKPDVRADLFAYLGGIIHEMRGRALIVNGTADHVHVLARIRPAHAPAEIARAIKANSSRPALHLALVSFAPSGLGWFAGPPRTCALGCILSPLRGWHSVSHQVRREMFENRASTHLGLRRPALPTRTHIPQKLPGINPQLMPVVPFELQRVLADRPCRNRFRRGLEHDQFSRLGLRRLPWLAPSLATLFVA